MLPYTYAHTCKKHRQMDNIQMDELTSDKIMADTSNFEEQKVFFFINMTRTEATSIAPFKGFCIQMPGTPFSFLQHPPLV